MDVKLRKYHDYLKNIKWYLRACGLWPYSHSLLKKILFFQSIFCAFITMIVVTNFCFQNITNVALLTRGMGQSVSYASVLMKLCVFLLHHDDLVFFNDVLNVKFSDDLKYEENRPLLLRRLGVFTNFLFVHSMSAGVTLTMFAINPLLAFFKYGKHLHVYPSVYPFTYKLGGLVYWILYYIEVVACWTLWTVTIGADCFFGLYAFQLCGELRVLAKQFKNLRVSPKYKNVLRDCIIRHHLLMEAKNRLVSLVELISFWLAVSGSLVLCALIFQVTESAKHTGSFMQMGRSFGYLTPKFLQVFMYAWYGNLVTEESKACLNAMFNSYWPDSCNTNFKNDILIVLTQKPFILIAKGCMFIRLDMFIRIVKTSVSYFCLLQTLNANNE